HPNEGLEADVSGVVARLPELPSGRASRAVGNELPAMPHLFGVEGSAAIQSRAGALPAYRCARACALHEMPSYDTRAGKVCQIRWARFREMQRVPRRSASRSEEHTSELQSPCNLVCRLLLEKKKKKKKKHKIIK